MYSRRPAVFAVMCCRSSAERAAGESATRCVACFAAVAAFRAFCVTSLAAPLNISGAKSVETSHGDAAGDCCVMAAARCPAEAAAPILAPNAPARRKVLRCPLASRLARAASRTARSRSTVASASSRWHSSSCWTVVLSPNPRLTLSTTTVGTLSDRAVAPPVSGDRPESGDRPVSGDRHDVCAAKNSDAPRRREMSTRLTKLMGSAS